MSVLELVTVIGSATLVAVIAIRVVLFVLLKCLGRRQGE